MSEYPRETIPPEGPTAYVGDRWVGGLLMAVNGVELVLSLLKIAQGPSPEAMRTLNPSERAGAYAVATTVILVISIVSLVVDYGLYRSRRWAFFVAMILALCATAGAVLMKQGTAGMAWGLLQVLGTLAYTLLRLCRAFGPELR